MRRCGEPHWLPQSPQDVSDAKGMLLFSRYADVEHIIKLTEGVSKRIGSASSGAPGNPFASQMLFEDDAEHQRLRNVVSHAFSPKAIKAMETHLDLLADEMITNAMEDTDTFDFIRDVAEPYPIHVISQMLGVPQGDKERVFGLSKRLTEGFDSSLNEGGAEERKKQTLEELAEYFHHLSRNKKNDSMTDLMDHMMEAHRHRDALSHREVLGMCMLMLYAGHETTTSLLGSGLNSLLREPDQMKVLCDHEHHLGSDIEEMMRFESPLQRATFRVTTKTISVNGKEVPEGVILSAIIASANRDEMVFKDAHVLMSSVLPIDTSASAWGLMLA